MKDILHILKYKLLGYSKFSLSIKIGDALKNIGSFVVYAGFAAGAFLFAVNILTFLLEKMRLGNFLVHEFLSIIFFIFFISINAGNIIVSWSTLYKSAEVNFLFTKPVKPYKIFIIKFFDNLFYSSSTLLMILLSLFLGYVLYYKLDLISLVYIFIFNLLPFIINAASLGVIILLITVKLASIIGARQLIISLVIFYIASLLIFFKMFSPVSLVYQVLAAYPNVNQYFDYLIPGLVKWLPNQWFSDSLYWTVNGDYLTSFKYSCFQLGSAFLSLSLAVYLGKKWYYKTWLMNISLKSKKEKKSITKEFLQWSGQTLSIIKKDLILFYRDSTQVIHFAVLIVLIMIFMASVSGISFTRFDDANLTALIYLVIVLFNVLLISSFSLRFVFPIVSLEGLTFWKIKSAPIENQKFLHVKLLPYLLFMNLLGILLTYFTHLSLAPHLMGVAILTIIPVTNAIVIFNFAMGIIFAKYNEKNAIRISSSKGASLTFLISLIFMLVLLIIFYFPINEHFKLVFTSYYFAYTYIYKASYIIFILSIITTTVFYILGIRSISKDF